MLRKAAILLMPLLLASANIAPAPRYAIRACPGTAMAKATTAVRRLFSDHPETRAVLILADGCPVLKAYAPGYSDANRFISWSMAKSITGILVGALVADGKLKLDAPAPVAEWHEIGDPRAAITLRQLLNMSSGLKHIEVGDPIEASDTNQTLFVTHTAAMAAAAIDHPLEAKPGTRFRYSSLTSIILAEIITRSLTGSHDPRERAKAYIDFAQSRLFRPAGVTSAVIEFDGAGTQIGGSLMHMTLGDWGRMGTLLLDGRSLTGAPVIAPAWLAFMKTPAPTNPEYGGHIWLNRPGGAEGTPTLFPGKGPASAVAMDGHLGQLVIASPESGPGRGVVVVRLGHTPDTADPPLMQALGDVVASFDRPAS